MVHPARPSAHASAFAGVHVIRVFRYARLLLLCFLALTALLPLLARAEVSTFTENFDGTTLDPAWTPRDGYAIANPGDTANHASIAPTGSHLSISLPGGAEHNMWWLRHAQLTRVYEGSGVYEIKVDSALDGDQQFGLVFENSPGTFLIFMLYSHDTIWGYVERFSNVDGVQYKHTFPGEDVFGHNTGLVAPAPGPFWLRVIVGDDPSPQNRLWKFQWSLDGQSWTTIVDGVLEASDPTQNIGAVQQVGVFAGNQPEDFSAFDARFDSYRTFPTWALPLDGPANLLATAGDHQIGLSWDAVGGAQQYSVHRSTSAGGPYSLIASTSTPGHVDSGLANGTRYFYVVTATVNGVQSQYSAETKGVPHPPDAPAGLPANGRILMLRAGELGYTLADGEAVRQWTDALSGPSGAALGAAGKSPSYVANAIAGQAAVRFDGQNDYLDLPAPFADFTDGLTLFVVARPSAVQTGAKLLLLGNGAGNANIALGRDGGGAGLQYFTTDAGGNYGWFVTSDALTNNAAALYTVEQPGGAASAPVPATVKRNGTQVGTGTVFVPPVTNRSANHIARSYWGSDGYYAGDIAEIILYNRALSDAERGQVHHYLGQKYALDVADALPPLPAPAALAATAGNAQVGLSWGAVNGATGYKLSRRVAGSGSYAQIYSGAATSYTDTGLTNGTVYEYVVRAFDGGRESVDSAPVQAKPVAPPSSRTICTTLGRTLLADVDTFLFEGRANELVSVRLAADPAGSSRGSRAKLRLYGNGLLKTDSSALPNSVSARLPVGGTYLVQVKEDYFRWDKFTGAYCVTLESSSTAWQTFRQK